MQPDAVELIDEAIDFADDLGLGVTHLEGGSTLVDAGIEAEGGYEAGLWLAELRFAGTVATDVRARPLGEHTWPVVDVIVDDPQGALEVGSAAHHLDDPAISLSGPSVDGPIDPFAVVIAESTDPLDERAVETIADHLGVEETSLYVTTVSPGHRTWCVYEAATSLLALGEALEAEDTLNGALLRVPVPPAGDEAQEFADTTRRLGSRAHLSFDGEIDPEVITTLTEVLATVTATDTEGTVLTKGEVDTSALFEELT